MERARFIAIVVSGIAVVTGMMLTLKGGGHNPPLVQASPGSAAPFDLASPTGALWLYLQDDFNGQRLEGANWLMFKGRVLWNNEPHWSSAYVVKSFRVGSGKIESTSATAECTFETLGELNLENFSYQSSPSTQVVPYKLTFDHEIWRIGFPMLRPHVSAAAAIDFLKRMKVGYPRLVSNIDQAIENIGDENKKARR